MSTKFEISIAEDGETPYLFNTASAEHWKGTPLSLSPDTTL
jgi:hypothetical protein